MQTTRPRRLLALTAAAGVLVLAACGHKEDPNATPAPSASDTPAASASASPSASATPKPVKPSDNLDALKVSGDYGKTP